MQEDMKEDRNWNPSIVKDSCLPEEYKPIKEISVKRKEYKKDCLEKLFTEAEAPAIAKEGGMKFLQGKLRWSLFPFDAAKKIMEIIDHGADKYKPDNWRDLPVDWLKDALIRHWERYDSGEFYDRDSGKSHLAHIGCNILFLIWLEEIKFGGKVR